MINPVRKLVGVFLMLALVTCYAFAAMALAEGRITLAPGWLQAILFAILGIAWVLPAMALISWMMKGEREAARAALSSSSRSASRGDRTPSRRP